jgi:hypothetical protein
MPALPPESGHRGHARPGQLWAITGHLPKPDACPLSREAGMHSFWGGVLKPSEKVKGDLRSRASVRHHVSVDGADRDGCFVDTVAVVCLSSWLDCLTHPLKRILRHPPSYLVWREKSYSNLLKSFDRFPEVRVRTSQYLHQWALPSAAPEDSSC